MFEAAVMTSWHSTPTSNRPKIDVDYENHPSVRLLRCRDITMQPAINIPPSPNIVTVLIRVATQAELDIIEADPAAMVLWAQELSGET